MHATHLVALLCTLLVVMPASARMYEWVNPASGRIQLSGTPPTWYRSVLAGPRVRVFDNGALVDDTAIELNAEENSAMREFATAKAAERRQLDALRQLEIATQREAALNEARAREAERLLAQADRRRAQESEAALSAPAAVASTSAPSEPVPDMPKGLDAQTIERLKSLISEFDRSSSGGQ